jgi:hypothetical protein
LQRHCAFKFPTVEILWGYGMRFKQRNDISQ